MSTSNEINGSASSGHNDLSSLYDRLDELWVRYLSLVDEYTTAQSAIMKDMSSGFFSLAQANFKSSGRRFGKDYYDQRAIATTKAKVSLEEGLPRTQVLKDEPSSDHNSETSDRSHEKHGKNESSGSDQLPTPQSTPELEGENDEKGEKSAKAFVDTYDPIRWFGILVPPQLRAAQKFFSSAVLDDHAVAKALNSARSMREVETEIRKLRKVLKKGERAKPSSDSAA